MDTNLIREIASQIVSEQLLGNWKFWGVFLLVTFLSGTTASFLVSYLKKRGQNFATKADFDDLLEQLKTTISETETIKIKISRLDEQRTKGVMEIHGLMCEVESLLFWGSGVASSSIISQTPVADALKALNKAWELIPEITRVAGYHVLIMEEDIYDEIGNWSKDVMGIVSNYGNPLEAQRLLIEGGDQQTLDQRVAQIDALQEKFLDPAIPPLGEKRHAIQERFKQMLGVTEPSKSLQSTSETA